MRADLETLSVERHGAHVLLLSLNRPAAANAMNTRMGHELMTLFETLSLDLEGLRCLVLTGSGEKGFCAGGDLKERNGMTVRRGWRSISSSSVCCAR